MSRAMQQGLIDDMNYGNDHRVRAGQRSDWFVEFDETKMTAKALAFDENGDDIEVETRVTFEICTTCGGKGSHVNPSIDASGISQEDFYEDPDLEEGYFSGRYDVSCYGCGGKRVIPVPEDERVMDRVRQISEWDAESHAERMAEINFGC